MRKLCGTILAAAMAVHGAGGAYVREDYSIWIDPFVGTSATGHTFPAACVPFGLVQAGPDTGNGSWRYCSGYRSEDNAICGFTQTHLNGTGCPDLGDVRILPTAESKLKVESDKLKVGFEKASETAGPGYYAVTLDGGTMKVEMSLGEFRKSRALKSPKTGALYVAVRPREVFGGLGRAIETDAICSKA